MAILWKRLRWPYWAFCIVLGILGPVVLAQFSLDQIVHFGLIYGVLYTVIAGVLGSIIKHRHDPRWLLLLWPASFLIGVLLAGPIDTAFFALVYLCVSYLSYGFSHD